MIKYLPRIRYGLELISVPVFAWLVIHLSGHGLMLLKDPDHSHGHSSMEVHEVYELDHEAPQVEDADHENHEEESHLEAETDHQEEPDDHNEAVPVEEHDHADHTFELSVNYFLSAEVLGGLLMLILFAWLWHQKPLKRFVPCSHDHCHHKTVWPHLLASAAFVFHWFPESQLRYELLNHFDVHELTDVLAAIGFLSHFLVDIIVLVLLVSFWPQRWQKSLVFGVMLLFWVISMKVGESGGLHLEGLAEPLVLLVSAFLLAMFVHKPHKPEPECTTCVH